MTREVNSSSPYFHKRRRRKELVNCTPFGCETLVRLLLGISAEMFCPSDV